MKFAVRHLALAVVIAGLLFAPDRAALAADQRCFAETGQCLSGRFRQFWEQNGGLAVFGLPTSAAQNEINRDTGQPYLTQWFERNRFELHAENPAPYDVLLGRLGDDLLHRRGIDWQTLPRENGSQAGCTWFTQTGHNVCDQEPGRGFKTYWQLHGLLDPELDGYQRSLALFGLPITAPQTETNSSGDTVVTQWFERARFEWHPDKPNDFKVLLGLLGNEVRLVPAGSRLLSANAVSAPVGAGSYIFWIDGQTPEYAIRGYNLADRSTITLAQHLPEFSQIASDGNGVVWVQAVQGGKLEITYFDLATRQSRTVVSELQGGSGVNGLALDGGTLVYTDLNPVHKGLYIRSIQSGDERLISLTGTAPVARDNRLLWTEATATGSNISARTTLQLHLRLQSGEERVINTAIQSGAPISYSGYDLLGDNVVWSLDGPSADGRIFRYQISSGAITPLSRDNASSPKLDGGSVVWATHPYFNVSNPGSTWKLVRYDLGTGAATSLTSQLPGQLARPVALAGGKVTTLIDTGVSGERLLRNLFLIGP